jgi:flavin reductase (DIM6/NTAB) family NADH-FMN oxidoreductase RutF
MNERSSAVSFDDLMGRLDHPMIVVTTAAGGARAGCLVGFHAQCAMEPPAYAVWLSKANHTYRVGVLADTFAVHFLRVEDRPLAVLFGTTSGDTVDAFEHCEWAEGPDGVPVLEQVVDRFVGRRCALLDACDDHVCLVLRPIEQHVGDGPLLGLRDVVDLQAGHDATERQRPD